MENQRGLGIFPKLSSEISGERRLKLRLLTTSAGPSPSHSAPLGCFPDGVRQAGAGEWQGVDSFPGLAQRSESTEGVCLAFSRERTLSLKTETLSQRMYLRKIFRWQVTFILFMT